MLAWLLRLGGPRWVSGTLSSPVELLSYSRSTTSLIRRFLLPNCEKEKWITKARIVGPWNASSYLCLSTFDPHLRIFPFYEPSPAAPSGCFLIVCTSDFSVAFWKKSCFFFPKTTKETAYNVLTILRVWWKFLLLRGLPRTPEHNRVRSLQSDNAAK